MKKLIKTIAKLFNSKLYYDSKLVRQAIYTHYAYRVNKPHLLNIITNVKYYMDCDFATNIIEITTHKPSLIIGQSGGDFEQLKEYINAIVKPKADIEYIITECKLWDNLI